MESNLEKVLAARRFDRVWLIMQCC